MIQKVLASMLSLVASAEKIIAPYFSNAHLITGEIQNGRGKTTKFDLKLKLGFRSFYLSKTFFAYS